jgi:transcriptional regulator with XRE-family HTH domain
VFLSSFLLNRPVFIITSLKDSGASKFKPLAENERAICDRIAALRRFKGISQKQLASLTGSTRDQVANIECNRVPLKAVLGLKICRVLDANPNWVYYGTGPQFPMLEMDDPLYWAVLSIVSDEELFSNAWSHAGGGRLTFLKGDSIVRHHLTNEREATILSGVKINSAGHLSELIDRARGLITKRGARSKLAKHLGVSRQAVSEWFTGKSYPGAETTLRLLKWVEQQERQK